MRGTRRIVLAMLSLGFVLSTAHAATATGTIMSGSDNNGFALGFGSEWNDSSDFICSVTSPGVFRVTAKTGTCAGRTATIRFSVNSGGTSNNSHTFVYNVQCTSTRITHDLGFDGGSQVPINSTFAVYDLSAALAPEGTGDQVVVQTTEGTVPKPAFGAVGVVVIAALMGLGFWLALRRRQLSPADC